MCLYAFTGEETLTLDLKKALEVGVVNEPGISF